MKKLAAFFTAALLFLVSAFGMHAFALSHIETNNRAFGTWISSKKDASYTALAANIQEDTVMMLGSSEFHHGKKTPYHPTAVFDKAKMNVMCIGAAKNQSFSHAITMAALAPKLQNKKAVLILSPSWFSAGGIDCAGFAARFSESLYTEMLQNDNLSADLRERLIKRTESLLETGSASRENAERETRVLFEGSASFEDKVKYYAHRIIAKERETISSGLMWQFSGLKSYSEYKKAEPCAAPDWNNLIDEADKKFFKNCSNEFYMNDSLYQMKVAPSQGKRKDSDLKRTYASSPEYDDLKLFLDVCKESNIDVMLVLLPVNGYWYDYTGFPRENRASVVDNVEQIAEQYGVKLCNFFGESYTPGFLEDIVHPAGKGWVMINEKAYEFFNDSQKTAR